VYFVNKSALLVGFTLAALAVAVIALRTDVEWGVSKTSDERLASAPAKSNKDSASGQAPSSKNAPQDSLPSWLGMPSGTGGPRPNLDEPTKPQSSYQPQTSYPYRPVPHYQPWRGSPYSGTYIGQYYPRLYYQKVCNRDRCWIQYFYGSAPDSPAPESERCQELGIAGPQCTDFETILKKLREVWTAYTCPKQMWKNRPETVALVLDATKTSDVSQEVARKEMATLLGASPENTIAKLTKLARHMSASLSGASFKIEPSGPQKLTVTEAAPVRWEWQVTPTEEGNKTITLTLAVEIGKDEENTKPVQIKTLVEKINVDVTTWDQALSIIPGINSLVVAIASIMAAFATAAAWLYRKAWLPLFHHRTTSARTKRKPQKSAAKIAR
jgi:hypothetical protein